MTSTKRRAAGSPVDEEQKRETLRERLRALELPKDPEPAVNRLEGKALNQAIKCVEDAVKALSKTAVILDAHCPAVVPNARATPAAPAVSVEPAGSVPARQRPAPASATGMRPTEEQAEICDCCADGDDLVVEAGAGTGKTTTLKMAAAGMRGRGLYLAYNRAIATEAKASFPKTVDCRTAHSLAYASVGRLYAGRLGIRVPAWRTAELLRILEPLRVNKELSLVPRTLARLASEAVDRFCHSAEEEVQLHHVAAIDGTTEAEMGLLRAEILPYARRLWQETQASSSPHRFTHDYYLKLWAMKKPVLRADYILLDEAQDSNPLVATLVQAQAAQKIAVGDSSQSIYGWRGATDALATWPAKHRLRLTQSWRFGQQIADEANAWLAQIEDSIRLTGNPALNSVVVTDTMTAPDAILCYTNAGTMNMAMTALNAGFRPALVGGGSQINDLAQAALTLREGKPASHPDLIAFQNWEQLEEFANTEGAGSDLRTFVRLVNEYGPEVIIEAVGYLVPEEKADIVLSTAHRAKGREWDNVFVAQDFSVPKRGREDKLDPPRRDKAMLGYVTVTRAKKELDNLGLAWIHECASGPERRAAGSSGTG
ncbi:UvrD-helicase domain-containing protein [Streptomyces sp. NPDC048629]|uniref:UvrD-helicase domain-containing protein n=1 Tax=Streptomyces sp. NPDC048629 TaxID=3154824 RepID=UPI00344398C5